MKKQWESLSITQAKFIDYVTLNLNKSQRIIFYKHYDHFGLEYALKARFKRAEILYLKQLKTKTEHNNFLRLLHIVMAIITSILNLKKNIDFRATTETILDNAENIYLGIAKEREYLKYLHIKKFSHKNRKIQFIIRIEESDLESNEDIDSLKFLCKLIESGKINNTMLLVSGNAINILNVALQRDIENIPVFQLTENDLKFIAQKSNLEFVNTMSENLILVQKFGLQFFLDNYYYFDSLAEIHKNNLNWIEKMDWLIGQIVKNSSITDRQLYPLLEFSSFFERRFSKIEIQNFKEDQLKADNLSVAQKLAIINQEKATTQFVPIYTFKREAFRQYFATKYCSDLVPMPKYVFQYFRENFPFEYISALNVLRIDSSFVDNKEMQSLITIGYYYQEIEKGISRYDKFLHLTTKESIATAIIHVHENFKKIVYTNKLTEIDFSDIKTRLRKGTLNDIATCAGYVIILQALKEDYIQFEGVDFSQTMKDFLATISKIESRDYYNKYWKAHFKCQYIALSLEDEKSNAATARKFLYDLNNMRNDENFSEFISDNHLRGFTRMDLLSYSLSADNAGDTLKHLYESSEESTIFKELARINYSAYLIENEDFRTAVKILNKTNENFLKNINNDTYYGYKNNLYLAQFGNKQIDVKKYICEMKKIVKMDINYSDKLIIKNNLSVGYLLDEHYIHRGENLLKDILNTGNSYNQFLSLHNLLSYYFDMGNEKEFSILYDKIFVPKLFLSDKTFFLKKFEWMKANIGQKNYESFKHSPRVPKCYNQKYLISSIERWFE